MTTEPDPKQMDRDALIAEVVTLRGHRDQLRRALHSIESIGGAVANTAMALDDALEEIGPLMRMTDPCPPQTVTHSVVFAAAATKVATTEYANGPGPIESALLNPAGTGGGVVYTREPDGSDQR
ncbi:hypothetical protein BOWSER_62 [Gordonia phage Bowser]|uniref:Uncharacterized protein n=1 Tax=Gordonia phage Bowser TaxID=1838063 RepID=A0A166Y3B0_9CAUD|nr:hypothetical protein BH770_gp62 [Gordonia phage Bowser]ANA85457.1 hypothetical protein BOWSER_62 [Gordonia phage Bowser]